MQIDKNMVVQFLQQHGKQQESEQAAQELPDSVDTEQHGGMLEKYGIDVPKLISAVAGDKLGGALGGKLGGLL